MTFAKTIKAFAIILLSIFLFESCTTTITKYRGPVFSESTDSLQLDLNKLVACQNVNLNGKEITTNGIVNSELEVDIINGQHIPHDKDQMNALGKRIAIKLKSALQDKKQYNDYRILFVTKKNNGVVTETSSDGKIFKSTQL